MNYCQFRNDVIKRMCNSVKPLLPPEYQQVEYIERPNIGGYKDPYINTSVPLTNTYYFEVRYMLLGYRGYGLFGSLTTQYPIGAARSSGNDRFIISPLKREAVLPNALNVVYTVTAYYDSDIADYRAFINGVESAYKTNGGGWTANNGFCILRSNWANPNYSSAARIYYVKIKDSYDGNTTLDLIPCYRKADNKPGMYDIVTNTFFTNAGTGEFTVGNNV